MHSYHNLLDSFEVKERKTWLASLKRLKRGWMLHTGYCRQKREDVTPIAEDGSLDIVGKAMQIR
jgi:hypothetical protein